MKGKHSAFGVTDKGKVRSANEDQFLIAELTKAMRVWQTSLPEPKLQVGEERAHLFLVADGMGGHAAGEVASHLMAGNQDAARAAACVMSPRAVGGTLTHTRLPPPAPAVRAPRRWFRVRPLAVGQLKNVWLRGQGVPAGPVCHAERR